MFYGRFKDDLLIITSSTLENDRRLFEQISVRSEHFVVTQDEVSDTTVTMLDVRLTVSENNRLLFEPYTKPTSQSRYLSSESYHQPNVHMSWPIARVKHLRHTASIPATRKAAGWNFHARLAAEAPGHVALNAVASEILESETSVSLKSIVAKPKSWITLKYSRTWAAAKFNGILSRVFREYAHLLTSHTTVDLSGGISWKLADHSVTNRINMVCRGRVD